MRQKQLHIVLLFIGINILIGRLFQESLNLVCFSELGIIGVSSLFFWSFFIKKMERVSLHSHPFKNTKNMFIHTGLGLSVSFANVLLSQLVIILSMVYIYNCTSPSFGILNASLTNNIALNLLCYLSLIFFHFHHAQTKPTLVAEKNLKIRQLPEMHEEKFVVLNSGNKQHVCFFEQIDYIEASNNCIILYTEKGQFVKYTSLTSFFNQELPKEFQRVHRSYVVNSKKIDYVQKNKNGDGTITLKNGNKVKLSRSFKLNL